MNREDIIRMAREAGAIHIHQNQKEFAVVGNQTIERFAALVAAAKETELMDSMTIAYMSGYQKGKDAGAAAEREACAKVCDSMRPTQQEFDQRFYTACIVNAAAIRARGQA